MVNKDRRLLLLAATAGCVSSAITSVYALSLAWRGDESSAALVGLIGFMQLGVAGLAWLWGNHRCST